MTQRWDGWRSPILEQFSEASARAGWLTVVSDPDALLTEPGVIERLAARGFELITFADPVAFRYAYETRFRQHWDRGEATHLVVVIRTDEGDFKNIPHDLLEEARETGRILSLSLGDVFPSLSPNVVAELDRQHFDALDSAVTHFSPGNLGANATRDFILQHVFRLVPGLITEPADLLRALLGRHYRSQTVPATFDERFIHLLAQNAAWRSWPLHRIVPDKSRFLEFLAERWPHFLIANGLEIVPGREPAWPAIPGPLDLPFDHPDVRVYMDNLFVEGILLPTAVVHPMSDDSWFAVGIVGAPASSDERRFIQLAEELSHTIPIAEDAPVSEWQAFAGRWATWVRLRWRTRAARDASAEAATGQLVARVQASFASWLMRWFGPISTLPYLPEPVVAHQVPHYLAHLLGRPSTERVALLVVDGMAFDQWRILEASFEEFKLEEHAIFSWIPTLTQVARQAIFSGRIPLEFASSIEGTYREQTHWATFWEDRGLRDSAIAYVAPQGRKTSFEPLAEQIRVAANDQRVQVLGAVIGVIDQNMHQIGLGTAGLHALVDVWRDTRQLPALVDELIALGFTIFLTADHGNAFGRGFGKPDVGETAEQRGERAHIFRHKAFRDAVAPRYPGAIEWPGIGLPEDYFPLIAPYGACFLPEDKEAVSHGGVALEEVVVPFVRIDAR